MIFKISKDNFLINFILSSIYLLIPFLEFIKQNFKDYNIQILTTIISIFILILVGGIFFSLFAISSALITFYIENKIDKLEYSLSETHILQKENKQTFQ